MEYLGGEKAFLGREFLTWLWFQTESGTGTFDHPDGRIGVVLDDYLGFVSDEEEAQEASLKKGNPARSPEAWMALMSGKKLAKARVQLAQGERSWSALITGDGLKISSTKMPELGVEPGDDMVAARLTDLEDFFGLVDHLFVAFLRVRLGDGWDGFVSECMQWASSSLDKLSAR